MKPTVGRMVRVRLAGQVFPAVIAATEETRPDVLAHGRVDLVVFVGRPSIRTGQPGVMLGGAVVRSEGGTLGLEDVEPAGESRLVGGEPAEGTWAWPPHFTEAELGGVG